MNAIIHELRQGSPEWHTHRAAHLNASDAAAMLGLSPYRTRAQLLQERATGITPEIDAATQARFDLGHEYELQAREWAEALIEEELYPVTMSREIDGMKLSASADGLTLDERIAWEHKTLNAKLAAALADGEIPDAYWPQLEHILLVTGAEEIILMASAGQQELLQWSRYRSRPERRQRLIEGWKAFAEDLANWQHASAAPTTILQPIQQLPSLLVQIEGRVLSTNLDAFKQAAEALISGIKTDLQDDADFAEAEQAAKFCADAEKRLDSVKAQALAQTASIEAVFRVMDGLKASLRATRLTLEKQVKTRKEQIRVEIIAKFRADITRHIDKLNADMGGRWLSTPPTAVLAEAIKGRKSIAACREVLHGKALEIKADLTAAAARLTRNRSILRTEEGDMFTLFPDFADVGQKQPEDFDALAELRIRRHREEEEKAVQAKADREAAAAQAAEAKRLAELAAITARLEANRAAAANPQAKEAAAPPDLALAEIPASTASEPPAHADEMTTPDCSAVTAFLKVRDFGDEHSRIRSILVEFVKFCSRCNHATGELFSAPPAADQGADDSYLDLRKALDQCQSQSDITRLVADLSKAHKKDATLAAIIRAREAELKPGA